MSPFMTTVITVIGQIGALIGSTTVGYLSTYYGRRLSMMVSCVIGEAIVPAYIIPRNLSLIASVFFEQFFVGGVWGPIPIHLVELSPPALRSLIVGLTYQLGNLQLGNLASSAASTIESTIGERYPIPPSPTGDKRYNYGRVIDVAIFLGAVWAFIMLFVFLGPEMSQEAREAEADLARECEDMRARGVSLIEIGISRAKGLGRGELPGMNEKAEEKAAISVQHIEEA